MNTNNETLWNKIDQNKIAMLVSKKADGSFYSRPMYTAQSEFNGDLFFFSDLSAGNTVNLIGGDKDVLVNYSSPSKNVYVSVHGRSDVIQERETLSQHWNPLMKAFFKDGLDTEDLCLIKVSVDKAEYWDADKNKFSMLYEILKATVTDGSPDLGDNETLNFK